MVRPMIKQCSGSGYFCDLCQHPLPPAGVVRSCGGLLHRLAEPQPVPDLARHDAPSFLEKVRNFASAAVSHVAAGMPMASDEEIIRRHDICLTCEHLQNDACQLCGCPVSRVAGYVSKLSWADQTCPAGKWGKSDG
jgi:hypothetical protein